MQQYMVDVKLPDELTEEMVLLIPAQRRKVNDYLGKGIIVSYTLALDRSKLWIVIAAKSEKDVKNIINSFPLKNFMHYKLHELAFSDQVSNVISTLSLN